MRSALRIALILVLLPAVAAAKDVYLSIAGSVGVFRTDTRIFNPSGTKDITITATYMPRVGAPNPAQIVKTITVPKRQMVIFDDVVSSLFQGTDLGAIKLSSADDFVATSRIYARTDTGTLGQFVVGLEPTAAKTKGVLIQLKANGAPGQQNTFRTNTGFVNTNTTEAIVTIYQYDRNNVVVGQALTITVPPMGVVFPVGGILDPSAGNFSDAWLGYTSSQPVLAFGSVVDNVTTDPTFIPAFEDTGSEPPPPPPSQLTVIVGPGTSFTPSALTVNIGDTVTWEFRATHTTTSDARTGAEVWDSGMKSSGTFSHAFSRSGTYKYHCAVHSTAGGVAMNGTIVVRESYQPPGY